jgi:clorobiocin biosynthesis protein CloN5
MSINLEYRTDLEEALIAFIRERFLAGDLADELTPDVPLLEWGVLDSLRTTVLISFIRGELGVPLRPSQVDATSFRTVRDIVRTLQATGPDAATGR